MNMFVSPLRKPTTAASEALANLIAAFLPLEDRPRDVSLRVTVNVHTLINTQSRPVNDELPASRNSPAAEGN